MRVLFLTRYGRLGASSRLRSFQYFPYLKSHGVEVTLSPLLDNDYIKGLYAGHVSWRTVVAGYLGRIKAILSCRQHDIVWIEKELLPWLPALFETQLWPHSVPVVIDYDDAIFHQYDQHRSPLVRKFLGKKIDVLMHRASLVTAGNPYLADRAIQAGAKRVEILPTVVDLERYQVGPAQDQAAITVGWVGSPATSHFLESVAPAISKIARRWPVHFTAIGANQLPAMDCLTHMVPWSEDTEVAQIQNFAIGIMPLFDQPFERGKCGYKLIQYMACGKPVIASPVGVNTRIVRQGIEGFLAVDEADWERALDELCKNAALRHQMGAAGRARVEAEYSLQRAAPQLMALLQSVAGT